MDGCENSTGESGSFRFTNSIDLLTLEPLERIIQKADEMWFAVKIAFAIYLLLPLVSLTLVLVGFHLARRRNGKP